ncbi:siderophore synthetase component/acyl-coenzyme A synthetase/AMP-(fatty) acid ligase [Methylorubrum zatmanii]|nr:siderophore synthetase component/acyl-coenzyme A synthetase/AMP-(fatty) acid ligase [Methylorubrum zatmanii]MCP1553765.1 siderophore synthetase component/acyl-coenzyme A synthetase/AMP-(fatty) acid ligase [Methylorubrum extorquens]MCP1579923.1 siderophore synthetase component/acyl-coenzyme A synthetase/AMP-(fatty) acid ligase [Methylorubrum extorquens]
MPSLRKTMEQPEARVLRQLAQAVLFEGLAEREPAYGPGRIAWRLGARCFRAAGTLGAFGRPRLDPGSVEMAGEEGAWMPADLAALVDALPAAPEHRARLLAELRQTVELCRWNCQNLSLPERRFLPFAALDAALWEGHPYHPSFKARTGFTLEDHRRYGPESAAPFRLEWLAVRRDTITLTLPGPEAAFWRAELGDAWDVLTRRLGETGHSLGTHALLPVHPWQMRRLEGEALRPWLADGRAVPLGTAGPRYVASQSLRTLHNFDDPSAASVKLALGVVSTSSLRILDPHFVLTGPALSDWLAGIVADDPALRGRVTVLREYAAALADRDGPLAGHLAAIWRESPRLAPGEAALPFNALAVCEADGSPFVAPWLDRYGRDAWLDRLVAVAVLPVWHLLAAHGVALEAHGQNMILVHRDGWPERVILRDFHESAEYAPDFVTNPERVPDFGAIDPAHAGPADDRFHAMRSAATLAELVTDSLFVFNLSEITALLGRRHGLDEVAFWRRLGRQLRHHAAAHGLEARFARLQVEAPRLRVEALLSRKLGLGEARGSLHAPNTLFHSPDTSSGDCMIEIDGRTIPADEMEAAIRRVTDAAALRGGSGERVAARFRDTAQSLAFILAARRSGASLLPIHPALPDEGARRLAARAGCHRLFLDGLEGEALDAAPPVPGEGELLQMSSGTTGEPKCIARPWGAVEREIESYVGAFTEPDGMTPVIACPITHSYGLICGLFVGLRRGRVPVIVDTTNPKYLLRRLREIERPVLYTAPAMLHTLARLLPGGESLHAAMVSGTLLPAPWFSAIRGRVTHLFQQYGCSEAGCIAINPDLRRADAIGRPLPHHRVRAGTGPEAPAEIVVEGEGGAIRTADLGYLQPDAMLVFVARKDDTINVSGLNVYPGEVEDVVMAMPGITDAVAFARPDPFAGERVTLLFSADTPVPPRALQDWCRRWLAGHQVPVEAVQVGAIPREANGKISRRAVAAQYRGGSLEAVA